MDNSKKEKVTFIELLKIIVKRVRISTLILLLITFASSSFAWFLYATRIQANISAHIDAWNIIFTANDTNISEVVTFEIPDLYPGMTSYTDSISAFNLGERTATVHFDVLSARILNVNYVVNGTSLTSDDMIYNLAHNYPFKIQLSLADDEVSGNEQTTFTLTVVWPYDSGNDELDTYWGNLAYNYKANNPAGTPSIELVVRVSAIQSNE